MNKLLARTGKPFFHIAPLAAALVVAGLLSACGGGGDNSQPASAAAGDAANGGKNDPPANSSGDVGAQPPPTVMACADGANYQCSGEQLASAGELALTEFGVQAYGRSTSDLAAITDATTATGFQVEKGGIAEVRIARNSDGAVSRVAVLLDQLGLSWDGEKDRPKIIEGFDPTAGRVTLAAGKLKFDNPLPLVSDTGFYDFARLGRNGTQASYAYNRYFPRNAQSRCNTSAYPTPCPTGATGNPTRETDGLHYAAGSWRAGDNQPDRVNATRFHEDGDIHAGDAADGSWLPGGSGHGVPFPGSKGYRTFTGLSYQYANLGAWFTQDTVSIAEWTGGTGIQEHNSNRRGINAFGALTNPLVIPATGSASYAGRIYGFYSPDKDADPSTFEGTATVSVDFAGRTASITIAPDNGAVPAAFSAATAFGTSAGNLANSTSGAANSGRLSGAVSARYFGPVTAGGSGQGPAETGGVFTLKNSATGEALVGGFIARKQ